MVLPGYLPNFSPCSFQKIMQKNNQKYMYMYYMYMYKTKIFFFKLYLVKYSSINNKLTNFKSAISLKKQNIPYSNQYFIITINK